MTSNKFSLIGRIKSFKYAINGIKILFWSEHNAWLHAAATMMVISLAYIYQVSYSEWMAIVLCIGFVISMEMMNTAVEKLCNLITTKSNQQIMQIKDLAAGAVLIAAIVSVVVASVIFVPKVF